MITPTRKSFRFQVLCASLRRCSLTALAASTVFALGAEDSARRFDVAAGELEPALRKFADQAGIHLIFVPNLSDGLRTKGVKGELSIGNAAHRLLAGTNLTLVPDKDSGIYSLTRVAAAEQGAGEADTAA